MAWLQYLPPDRVRWTNGVDSYPLWPSEPDMSVISSLAASALGVDRDSITVRFLADGAHHKVYDVVPKEASSISTSYVFRVATPVEPTCKLESEVATLEFLRQRTTIPVPSPVAWNSSAANALGYEWAMFEKILGVELREVWRKVPWDKKVEIIEMLATYLTQIWSQELRFSQIGSLYFSTFLDADLPAVSIHASNSDEPPSSTMVKINDARNGSFKIGPAIDGAFFSGRRRYLASDRGPFNSCNEWLGALIGIEKDFLQTAEELLTTQETMPTEYQAQDWDELVDEIGIDDFGFLDICGDMIDLCNDYLYLLPYLFPQNQEIEAHEHQPAAKTRFILHHCDLREANILVDPETFVITGIIDWEQTCAVPEWYGLDYPMLINKQEPLNKQRPSQPPPPMFLDSHDDHNLLPSVTEYYRWEAKELRDAFDLKLENLGHARDWRPQSSDDQFKLQFIQGVSDLSDVWERSIKRLRNVRHGLEHRGDI